MTMNKITQKLRHKNKKNYYLLLFCTCLSVMLVTSFALMYLSDTVQSILPIGGDSRKQAIMIFAIAIIGCSVFTTYASSLFFRYKSREFGVFLALGEKKSNLKKLLLKELSIVISAASLVGLILSIPLSYLIWKLFQLFIVDTKEMQYQFSMGGFCFGILFCIFVTICIFIIGSKFIKQTNIIDIISESKKNETFKEIKSWWGIVGWGLFFAGIFLGYLAPSIAINVFSYRLPSIWNVTFGFSFIGLYMIMEYTVIYSKKGKNAGKYYKNIVSSSMMKFSGKQTVKNMCVITFLVAGALFAAFYTPTVISGAFVSINNRTIDNSFFYRQDQKILSQEEIQGLAEEYQVEVLNYKEAETISLITDGIMRDYEGNKFVETYEEKLGVAEFISESQYNYISGQSVEIKSGDYITNSSDDTIDGFWEKENDMSRITHPVTGRMESVRFQGNAVFSAINFPGTKLYVISDEDYRRLEENMESKYKHRLIFFDIAEDENSYSYVKRLKEEIVNRSTDEVAMIANYSFYQKQQCVEAGEPYWADDWKPELTNENNLLSNEWKYYPQFNELSKQDLVKNFAVFLMLFIYISIICFAAVGIIAYTRSITIAMDNDMLFSNLKKLGANQQYIRQVVKKQLLKIFIYPTAVGSIAIYLFFFLIMFANGGGGVSTSEYIALGINAIIILITCGYMYIIYRFAYHKVMSMIER